MITQDQASNLMSAAFWAGMLIGFLTSCAITAVVEFLKRRAIARITKEPTT